MFSLRVCWLLAAELNTGFARHFVLHRQNIIFIQPWQLYTLATLEDTGSVSDSSSVSESEIPYSTRILLMTVEKLNFEEGPGRISTFLLCAWSRGLEGEARPILPASPRALHALSRWRAWSVQLCWWQRLWWCPRLCNNHRWVFYSIKIISIYFQLLRKVL